MNTKYPKYYLMMWIAIALVVCGVALLYYLVHNGTAATLASLLIGAGMRFTFRCGELERDAYHAKK